MPKRKQASESKCARPPPPPPPPKSLIRLLQTDKNVLKYFTLLQENLEADKRKWKRRVQDAENELDALKNKLSDQTQIDHSTNKLVATLTQTPMTKTANTKSFEKSENTPNFSINEDNDPAQGEAIDDDMLGDIFDNLSSDDESESSVDLGFNKTGDTRQARAFSIESCDDEERSRDLVAQKPRPNVNASDSSSSDVDGRVTFSDSERLLTRPKDLQHPFRDVIYRRLCEAHDNLERLGVALVDEDGSRRSDEDVVEDILQALRTVSRVQIMSRVNERTAPFMNMIPACDREDHPAYEAKQCAITALLAMDLLCAESEAREWAELTTTTDKESRESIKVGFRNRQALVKNLMQSLSAEVSDAWSVADRSTRVISSALHFDPSECDEHVKRNRSGEGLEFGAKSQARLSRMLERCMLVQLLTHYYDHRNLSSERVHLLCRYVLSSAPSLVAEDYPKYPPVLDMVVIEALVPQRCGPPSSGNSVRTDDEERSALQAVALAVHFAMFIWQQRLHSNDDRISDVAQVQVACYERVLKLELDWFGTRLSSLNDFETKARAFNFRDSMIGASILAIIDKSLHANLYETAKSYEVSGWLDATIAHCVAVRNLEVRRLDMYREVVGTHADTDAFSEQQRFLASVAGAVRQCPDAYWSSIAILVKCCVHLSDGVRASFLAQDVMKMTLSLQTCVTSHEALLSLVKLSQIPLIRFINLKRRVDRRNFFQAQAKVEKLLIVDAVADLEATESNDHFFWGCYAFDGRSESVADSVGDNVATHWRPSDLKAFDKDALSDERLIKMSSSERACALSHIASWEGVRRSLQLPRSTGLPNGSCSYPDRIKRLFRISGFARGKALLEDNEAMPPSAVSIILEDDAILVDRFVDRIEALLEQLPRDFHFCSLGYSRPRSAPIIPYSKDLGIPTCIWYLTGYILSLEGVKYLQHKLPVTGPVDSWIGLLMYSNWDNTYGQAIGVGIQSKPSSDLPSRKELGQLMKFKAFCALSPLCSQRVNAPASGGRGSWRHRDTDVDYSGL